MVGSPSEDEATLQVLARSKIFGALDPPARSALVTALTRRALAPGEVLVQQGERAEALFIVATGQLRVCVRQPGEPEEVIDAIGPGDTAGEMQLIVGGVASATVVAESETDVLRLGRQEFHQLCARWPVVLESVARVARRRVQRQQMLDALPALLGPLDRDVLAAIERQATWLSLRSGEVLFRQGDPGDAWFVVASGRLAVVEPRRDGRADRLLAEVGRGQAIGELALLTGEARSATVQALRDSELVRFPMSEFARLLASVPQVLNAMLHTLAQRIVRREPTSERARTALTLTIVPASPQVAIDSFAARLTAGLARHGPVLAVSSEHLHDIGIGPEALDRPDTHPGWVRLGAWLEAQGAAHQFLVLVADAEPNGWSARAVGQADHVILVADADADVRPGPLERALMPPRPAHRGARRLLVLLHHEAAHLPQGTARWLDARAVDAHLHVRLSRADDVSRVARFLAGRAISLALSGGGARGFAHLGVVRAMRELGIPIDGVAGTSSGALSAFLVAAERTDDEMRRAAQLFHEAGPFRGFTVPVFSLKRGERLRASLIAQGGRTHLEDLWLPMTAVSSNLTRRAAELHTRGPAWQALRASSALPGVLEPQVQRGEVLVDGALIDNLPVRVARDRVPGLVVAVNASGTTPLQHVEGYPKPWVALLGRLLGRRDHAGIPGVFDVVTQSMLLASLASSEQMRHEADLYLQPELSEFPMSATALSAQIIDAGYEHALDRLPALLPSGADRW